VVAWFLVMDGLLVGVVVGWFALMVGLRVCIVCLSSHSLFVLDLSHCFISRFLVIRSTLV
jgi:hypothetical protein